MKMTELEMTARSNSLDPGWRWALEAPGVGLSEESSCAALTRFYKLCKEGGEELARQRESNLDNGLALRLVRCVGCAMFTLEGNKDKLLLGIGIGT